MITVASVPSAHLNDHKRGYSVIQTSQVRVCDPTHRAEIPRKARLGHLNNGIEGMSTSLVVGRILRTKLRECCLRTPELYNTGAAERSHALVPFFLCRSQSSEIGRTDLLPILRVTQPESESGIPFLVWVR